MTTANHLINFLAAQDKDSANSAFEAMIQDKMADYLEVRKVELASTIMDDLQEGAGSTPARQYVRQVAAIGRAFTKDGKPTRRTIHQGELKAHAAKNVKKLGPETVQYHADVIKAARVGAKIRAKVDAMKAKGVSEALEGGSKSTKLAPSNAQLNRNVLTNIRRAMQTLKIKNINPTQAAAGHRDFGKLAAKNPKAPGYMLMRKLGAQKAQAVQSLSQSGVPLGQSLEANPNEFNQALQRIKRFK